MFTGLIEDVGTLAAIEHNGRTAKVHVKTGLDTSKIKLGDSIAVNGACLTVEAKHGDTIVFHALAETLSRTNLGQATPGARLNLEQAMMLGGRLGGHIVTGHVDYCGKVASIGIEKDDFEVKITIPKGQRRFFAEKGSVAVNGVSLTIAALSENSFTVCLIPVTRSHTNLDFLKKDSTVNIETDILGKYVANMLAPEAGDNITMDTLIKAGF